MSAEGEVHVRAASGKRRLTLDPIRVIPVTVEVREVESTLPCGFRVGWLDGTVGEGEAETSFSLEAGAGVGSRWLTLRVGEGKARREFCMDIEDFLRAFLRVSGTYPGEEP